MEKDLSRIAEALERLSPPREGWADLDAHNAFVWSAEKAALVPVSKVNHVPLDLLLGIDHVKKILLGNTERFSMGLPANNALLWGARGMGKSSLVKAIHAHINAQEADSLVLVEIHREDIHQLPMLLNVLKHSKRRFVVLCDDLSFDQGDTSHKSLKTVLDGGLEGRPENVLFYATSNRRHLMPRAMIENEQATAVNPSEAIEEKVSLSDRFGLWLGFHTCSEDTFFAMVEHYAQNFGLRVEKGKLQAEAKEWAMTRGARSGRVAWQFIQDLAGRHGKKI